jgi:hypothetical protein
MYDIWYCPNYPIEAINYSVKTDRSERRKLRDALAVDIRENGLVNPLIILNHRPLHRFRDHYVMQGLNRLEALRSLGWSTIPCIVTGECEHEPKVLVARGDLQAYFFDGTIIFKYWGSEIKRDYFERPHVTGVTLPETYKYPTSECKSEVRNGVYRHQDYSSLHV